MILTFGREHGFKVSVAADLTQAAEVGLYISVFVFASGQIFFIESVCDDPGVIASNIMVSPRRRVAVRLPSGALLRASPSPCRK